MTTVNATHDEFKEEVFSYLDELRESGITNMFGAGAISKLNLTFLQVSLVNYWENG